MSMSIKRALKIRDRGVEVYRGIFDAAAHFGHLHQQMLDKRGDFLLKYAKAPHWVYAYLEGYWACLQTQAYKDDLVYGGFVQNHFYSVHRQREDYYEKWGFSARDFHEQARDLGHYWVTTFYGKPMPFFVNTEETISHESAEPKADVGVSQASAGSGSDV